MRSKLLPLLKIVLIVEIVYLVLVNAILNLPLTQTVINGVKPEKFNVSWESAWSLYPFRVHARGISATGQSSTQQWQIRTPAASASISLLPLLWRSVNLADVETTDVDYRQRPRPRTDRDYGGIRQFFPSIEGRELETVPVDVQPTKKDKKAWDISAENVLARGRHNVWLYQMRGKLQGQMRADLTFRTRGGPFSLGSGEVDIQLDSLTLNEDHELVREGHISGTIEVAPFVPKENKGLAALEFLTVDADVRTETESLAFLNIYLGRFDGMQVDGAGLVQGRLKLRRGEMQADSKISVSARELTLDLLGKRFAGDGSITVAASANEQERDVTIQFANIEAFDNAGDVLLFKGEGLVVEARGGRSITSSQKKRFKASRLTVTIPAVDVPDLSAFQSYIPDKWSTRLYGGEGTLQGSAEITQTGLNFNLRLTSEAADVGIEEFRFRSNLDTAFAVSSPAIASGVDVSGTYIHLNGASLSHDEQREAKPWQASVDIEKGELQLRLPEEIPQDASFRDLYESLKGQDLLPMLHSEGQAIRIRSKISDLEWLGVLFKNRLNFAITGSGEIAADIHLSQGWPAAGTKLQILPGPLGVEVLDYAAHGSGEASLFIVESGESNDMKLSVMLDDAMMRRKNEDQTFIEDVTIRLEALAPEVNFGDEGRDTNLQLHLQIPSAVVRDMTVYNHYLPKNSPIQFTGGRAELLTDIKLTSDTADGYVRLEADGLSASVDEQDVSGALEAHITLVDGVPQDMEFDISGSSITLDSVRIVGDERSHDDEDWSARFELTKGRALWKRPVQLQVEAHLEMTNSKPIVAVIANQRGKHGWLEKALTIDDVDGEATLHMAQDRIVIPYAYADSDKIDVGAKGVISADERDGVLYVRFRKLHGILKIRDGKRNIDVLKAREKFDRYDTEAVLKRISPNRGMGEAGLHTDQ